MNDIPYQKIGEYLKKNNLWMVFYAGILIDRKDCQRFEDERKKQTRKLRVKEV